MSQQNTDNSDLYIRYKEGDREAFTQLFTQYYVLLCSYAQTFVSEENSEEIVQDLMVHLWLERDRIEIKSSLKSYLYQAVKNRCLNVISQNSKKSSFYDLMYEEAQYFFDDTNPLLISELSSKIETAIANLPEAYKYVFEKNRYDKKTYQEIATELGVSPKTVDYRMQQALKSLRKELVEYTPITTALLINGALILICENSFIRI